MLCLLKKQFNLDSWLNNRFSTRQAQNQTANALLKIINFIYFHQTLSDQIPVNVTSNRKFTSVQTTTYLNLTKSQSALKGQKNGTFQSWYNRHYSCC
ncbi:hypothetical protein NSTC731_06270 [Nostoc sp. DSM 114167]|jgi:hypothetical protein